MQAIRKNYPVPANEEARLKSLYDYEILDTLFEEEYDNITRIAAQICNTPVSLITLLDRDRQWFKSNYGMGGSETPREVAICNYTILDKDNVLVIPDLRKDERYATKPFVTGEPYLVFYAGAPLVTPDGYVLGSICVLDAKVNALTEDQLNALKALAQKVMTKMELQKKVKELKATRQELNEAYLQLKELLHIVSHDIKTPLANISLVSGAFKNEYREKFDDGATEYIDLIERSAREMITFISDVLAQPLSTINKMQ